MSDFEVGHGGFEMSFNDVAAEYAGQLMAEENGRRTDGFVDRTLKLLSTMLLSDAKDAVLAMHKGDFSDIKTGFDSVFGYAVQKAFQLIISSDATSLRKVGLRPIPQLTQDQRKVLNEFLSTTKYPHPNDLLFHGNFLDRLYKGFVDPSPLTKKGRVLRQICSDLLIRSKPK